MKDQKISMFIGELVSVLTKYDATILRSADEKRNVIIAIQEDGEQINYEVDEEISKHYYKVNRLEANK